MLQLLPFTDFAQVHMRGVPFSVVCATSTLATSVLLLTLLWWRRSASLTALRALAAGLALVPLAVVRSIVLWRVGLNGFGALCLTWYDLVLALPIACASVWIAARRGARVDRGALRLSWLGFGAIGVGVYASAIEPRRLVVESVTCRLERDRVGAEPIRIAVLADLQNWRIGEFEWDVARALRAQQPDLVLLPGDLFQGSPAQYAAARAELVRLLRFLAETAPTYAVLGDTDEGADFQQLVADGGVTVLWNTSTTIRVKDRLVRLGGALPFHVFHDHVGKHGEATRDRLDRVYTRAFDAEPDDGAIRILFGHHGEIFDDLRRDSSVDLVVAGHTHGGQVQLPGFGPPITFSGLPNRIAAGGLFRPHGATWIYQSRGIGLERHQAPRIRFLCPPTLGIVELVEAEPVKSS
jgi:predicted MPP superfamily phosphohydrolase